MQTLRILLKSGLDANLCPNVTYANSKIDRGRGHRAEESGGVRGQDSASNCPTRQNVPRAELSNMERFCSIDLFFSLDVVVAVSSEEKKIRIKKNHILT